MQNRSDSSRPSLRRLVIGQPPKSLQTVLRIFSPRRSRSAAAYYVVYQWNQHWCFFCAVTFTRRFHIFWFYSWNSLCLSSQGSNRARTGHERISTTTV